MLRLLFRIVFFVMIAFGALVGLVYPWAVANETGYEVGSWQVFDPGNGFAELEMILPPEANLVRARLRIGTSEPVAVDDATVLVMTVKSGDWTISAQSFALDDAEDAPAAGRLAYTVISEPIHVLGDEAYSFSFENGWREIPLASLEITLLGGFHDIDEAVPPIGWGVMAAGFLGFGLTLRKRREKKEPPRRWGRG